MGRLSSTFRRFSLSFYLARQITNRFSSRQNYLDRTSILIPFPPALYKPLPVIIKRTLFLDFEMFQFDEKTDGKLALEKEAKRSEETA